MHILVKNEPSINKSELCIETVRCDDLTPLDTKNVDNGFFHKNRITIDFKDYLGSLFFLRERERVCVWK